MVIVAVAGLTLSGGQPVSAPKPEKIRQKTVYVDLDKLVSKHPAWESVSDVRMVVDSVRAGSVKIAVTKPGIKIADGFAKAAAEDKAVREELVTRAIAIADEAMVRLEEQQSAVVEAGLAQRRETMKKSAEAEIMAQVKDIEKQTSADVAKIASDYCPDRINAELKVAALRNQIDKPGVDTKVAQAKLDGFQAELSRIEGECSAQTDAVLDDAREKIDSLWANSADKTNAALSIIESGEKRKIKNRSAASRYEILKDMLNLYDSGNSSVVSAKKQSLPVVNSAALSAENGIPGGVGNWPANDSALENRIRQDVKSAVARIARTQGVVVVFSRSSDNVSDATERFLHLMNRNAWQFCSPVMSLVSG